MKQLPHIASALYCQPWNILPAEHIQLCSAFRDYLRRPEPPLEFASRATIDRPQFSIAGAEQCQSPMGAADSPVGPSWKDDEGKEQCWHPQVQVIGNIAILPIRGTLGKHLSTLAMWCGASDYAIIAKQAENIAQDRRITDVIFYIDSPGGACVGCLECAKALEKLSAVKSTVSFFDKMCASAGYFLACAADIIIGTPSAIGGSISTYSAFVDESRAYEMEGLEVKMFRTGNVKGTGFPGKPWTPEEEADMQRVADQFSDQFKSYVRERRGLDEASMQGQYWPAQFAPENLIDDTVDSIEELIATIRKPAMGMRI